MRVIAGISAERTVVRGVLFPDPLGNEADPAVLSEVERQIDDNASESAIVAVLEMLAEQPSDAVLEDAAIVYRTVAERRAVVSELASRRWQTASHVSINSALLGMVRGMPGAADFGTVAALELLEQHTAFVVVGPDRAHALTSDSWPSGVDDAGSTGAAVGRIRPILDSLEIRPDAVVICGSAARDPHIASVLKLWFDVPVIVAPDPINAVVRGAVLAATDRAPIPEIERPRGNRRYARPALIAAGAAILLAASGFAVAQVRDNRAPLAEVHSRTVDPPLPTAPLPRAPQPSPPEPARAPVTTVPAPATARRPTPVHTARPVTTDPATPKTRTDTTPPTPAPAPSRVGPPNAAWLFSGESPPPPMGADPAVTRAWWNNHLQLEQGWLHGG